jgi:hypothetical protein
MDGNFHVIDGQEPLRRARGQAPGQRDVRQRVQNGLWDKMAHLDVPGKISLSPECSRRPAARGMICQFSWRDAKRIIIESMKNLYLNQEFSVRI